MTSANAATLVAAFVLALGLTSTTSTLSLAQTPATPAAIFISIGDKPAILYDAPSSKANRNFILARFQPLEVLVKLDKWTKVRDAENTVGWIENAFIGERRFTQISANIAEVRAATSLAAALVFEAQRGVVLEITGQAADGWVPVRHRDGQAGFVRASLLWGG